MLYLSLHMTIAMNSQVWAEKHFPVSKSTLLMHWEIIRKFRCRKSGSRCEDKKDGVSQHCYLQSGAVRMMVVTERQFNAIDLLIGEEKTCDLPQNSKQLMEF